MVYNQTIIITFRERNTHNIVIKSYDFRGELEINQQKLYNNMVSIGYVFNGDINNFRINQIDYKKPKIVIIADLYIDNIYMRKLKIMEFV